MAACIIIIQVAEMLTFFQCHLYVSFMDLNVGLFGCEERTRIQMSHHNSSSYRRTGMQQLVLPRT